MRDKTIHSKADVIATINWVGHGKPLRRLLLMNIGYWWFVSVFAVGCEFAFAPQLTRACLLPVPPLSSIVALVTIGVAYGSAVAWTTVRHLAAQTNGAVFMTSLAVRHYPVRMPVGVLLGLIAGAAVLWEAAKFDAVSQWPWPLLRLILCHLVPVVLTMTTVSGVSSYLWVHKYERRIDAAVMVDTRAAQWMATTDSTRKEGTLIES